MFLFLNCSTNVIAGPRTSSTFDVFLSAAKLWNTCVDTSALKYSAVTSSPETIANAAIYDCTNEGEITLLTMVDFLKTLERNQALDNSEIELEAQGDYLKYQRTILNRVTKQYLDKKIENKELTPTLNQQPKNTQMF